MLLFDWSKIYEASESSPAMCVLILRMLVENLVPKNKYDPIYKFYGKSFIGASFLVHPDVLLYNRFRYTNKEVAQYMALASLRSVAEYYVSGQVTLPKTQTPIDDELIKNNRLLRIDKNGDIHFLYEEVPQEKH